MKRLSVSQERVIELLLAGKTQKEAAAEAGVAAETVSRWRKSNDAFREALGARRRELRAAQAERLRSLAGRAMGALEELLESRNGRVRLGAATAVLKVAFAEKGERYSEEEFEAAFHEWLGDRCKEIVEDVRWGPYGGPAGGYRPAGM